MREIARAAGATILIAGPTVLAFRSGGYFDEPRLIAGIVAWALVLLAAVVTGRPLPRSTPGRIALGALALLTVWTLLSISWAPIAGRAENDAQRLLVYLGVFAAALALLDQPWVRRWLEPLLTAGALVVTLYGLSERLFPGVIELRRSLTAEGRLEMPLTYWNAEGAVAAIGLVLAIRLAGDPLRPRALRGCAAAGGVVLGLGAYLTFSRGALAALTVGVLVLLAFAPAGLEQLRALGAVVGPSFVAAATTGLLPTVRSLGHRAQGDAGEGIVMLVVLVLMAALAAGLVLARGRGTPAARSRPLPMARSKLVGGIAAVAVLGAVIAIAVFEGQPATQSPERDTGPARFGSIDTNRYDYWDAAIGMFADEPVTGVGSGGFKVEWRKRSDRLDPAVDAHSLYLETPAELGLVGLVLLVAFLCGVTACGMRLLRRDPAVAVGPLAVCAAWALHAGLDWDWEMPAVTLPPLLLAAALVAWSETETPARAATTGLADPAGHDGQPSENVREPVSDLLRMLLRWPDALPRFRSRVRSGDVCEHLPR